MKRNGEIRTAIIDAGLHQWEIAEKLGVTEGTFCKWLRYELSEDRKMRILAAIHELANDGND